LYYSAFKRTGVILRREMLATRLRTSRKPREVRHPLHLRCQRFATQGVLAGEVRHPPYPILRSAGQPIRPGPLSFHREQPLASNAVQTKPVWSRSVGANEPAHPPLAASGPYLPSLSFVPSARHDLRQEPYAGNPPVRICAGGTEQSVSLPRLPPPDAVGGALFSFPRHGTLGRRVTPEPAFGTTTLSCSRR
jgi:hypothetical protein